MRCAALALLLAAATVAAPAGADDDAQPANADRDNGYSDSVNAAESNESRESDDGAASAAPDDIALAECARLLAQRRIGHRGQTKGSEVSLVGRDCERLFNGSTH
jgi:hypothetical protein